MAAVQRAPPPLLPTSLSDCCAAWVAGSEEARVDIPYVLDAPSQWPTSPYFIFRPTTMFFRAVSTCAGGAAAMARDEAKRRQFAKHAGTLYAVVPLWMETAFSAGPLWICSVTLASWPRATLRVP